MENIIINIQHFELEWRIKRNVGIKRKLGLYKKLRFLIDKWIY